MVYTAGIIKSNNILFVTCAEYNRCRPYREMVTYNPLTNNAVLRKIIVKKINVSLSLTPTGK
jgi:hypothetical protein